MWADDEHTPALRILDDAGSELRRFTGPEARGAWALSPDAARLLHVTDEALVVIDLAATVAPRFLLAALALPEDTEHWRELAARHAVPVNTATVAELLSRSAPLGAR